MPTRDAALVGRVRQYLEANSSSEVVNLEEVAEALQKQYPMEYGRRKKAAFKTAVESAFQSVQVDAEKLRSQNDGMEVEEQEQKNDAPVSMNDSLKKMYQAVAESAPRAVSESEGTEAGGRERATSGEKSTPRKPGQQRRQSYHPNTIPGMMNAMYEVIHDKKNVKMAASDHGVQKNALNLYILDERDGFTAYMSDYKPSGRASDYHNNANLKSMYSDFDREGSGRSRGGVGMPRNKQMYTKEEISQMDDDRRLQMAIDTVVDGERGVKSASRYFGVDKRALMDAVAAERDKQIAEEKRREDVADERLEIERKRQKAMEAFRIHDHRRRRRPGHETIPNIKLKEVGGLGKLIEELCQQIVHLNHPEVLCDVGVSPPTGFLLHGPPGVGKTLLAHAIAGELDLPMVKSTATELMSGVSGETEHQLRELFKKAQAWAPCVLFLDEMDAISQKRENAQREMERRVVSQLISCLDGMNRPTVGQVGQKNHVLVLGATSRPDSIDPALRRAGRFDKEICIGIPDMNARLEILKVVLRNLSLPEMFDFQKLAFSTPGFVGADLVSVGSEAAMHAVNRIFTSVERDYKIEKMKRAQEDLRKKRYAEKLAERKRQFDERREERRKAKQEAAEKAKQEAAEKAKQEAAEKAKQEAAEKAKQEAAEKAKAESETADEKEDSEETGGTDEDKTTTKEKEEEKKEEKKEEEKPVVKEEEEEEEEEEEPMEVSEDEAEEFDPSKVGEASALEVFRWLRYNKRPIPVDQLRSLHVEWEDFEAALRVVQPSAKREGFATIPGVTWADIGALGHVRQELEIAIMAPIRRPEQFAALGLTVPQGFLLAGPPGCGKTLVAKAIANETGLNFISIKGPELLNMYVGESERAVRVVFERAKNSSPCVIFFDELDSLCPKRNENFDHSARVVNQLLTEMDGMEPRKQVFVIGATNRPDIIDPAMLRPGRLDKILYIGLPTEQERLDILKTVVTQTYGADQKKLSADVDLRKIAADARCARFTGADLAALVREAATNALKSYVAELEAQESKEEPEGEPPAIITMKDFSQAFSTVTPSVSVKDEKLYEAMAAKYAVKAASPPKAAGGKTAASTVSDGEAGGPRGGRPSRRRKSSH